MQTATLILRYFFPASAGSPSTTSLVEPSEAGIADDETTEDGTRERNAELDQEDEEGVGGESETEMEMDMGKEVESPSSSLLSETKSQGLSSEDGTINVLSGFPTSLVPQYFRLKKTLLNQKPSFLGSSSLVEVEAKDPCQSPAPLEWGELRSAPALATPAFEVSSSVYPGTPSFENDSTETLRPSTFENAVDDALSLCYTP